MELVVDVIDQPETPTAVVRGHVRAEEITAFLGKAFGAVQAELGSQGAHPGGPPFASFEPAGGATFDVEAGFPVDRVVGENGDVRAGVLPGGSVAQVLHRGAYGEIGPVYAALDRWLDEHGYDRSGTAWESYLDTPQTAAPRTLLRAPCTARQHE